LIVISNSVGFFRTIPAMNCDRNILPRPSKLATEPEGSFLNHSRALRASVSGKAL